MGIGYPGAPIEFALAGLDLGSDPDPIQSNRITGSASGDYQETYASVAASSQHQLVAGTIRGPRRSELAAAP